MGIANVKGIDRVSRPKRLVQMAQERIAKPGSISAKQSK